MGPGQTVVEYSLIFSPSSATIRFYERRFKNTGVISNDQVQDVLGVVGEGTVGDIQSAVVHKLFQLKQLTQAYRL